MTPPVVYFDGYCGLCNRWVGWLLKRDRRRRFRFAPLSGATAAVRLAALPDRAALDTVVLEDGGQFRIRSDAVLSILAELGGAWRLTAALRLIPRFLRDALYDTIARRRVRWFGRLHACSLPAASDSPRFLP